MSVQVKQRIDFVDLAKGFCILLVVLEHSFSHYDIHTQVDVTLGAFRMPLYFFLSGLFFKEYEGFGGFIKRKINKLLIPFLFFYLTCSVFLPNVLYVFGYSVRNIDNIGWLNSLLAVVSPTQRSFSNGPIWFLICLFIINIIFYLCQILVRKTTANDYILLVLSFFIGYIGYYLGKNSIQLPLYIDTALSSLPFYVCGYYLKNKTDILLPNHLDKYLPLLAVLCLFVTTLIATPTNFQYNVFENFYSLYLGGILGTLFIIFISKIIKSLPLISYWGRYSIIVLCTHQMVIQFILLFIRNYTLSVWIIATIAFVVTMGLELLIIPFCCKYLPYVTAQKDVIKVS